MKITVCGAAGRMGQSILGIAKYDEAVQVCGAVEYESSQAIGTGTPAIIPASSLESVLPQTEALIDFTNPDSALKNLELARKYKIPVIIGTTGFIAEQKEKIAEASKEIPIVSSPNMSVGVNILFKLVEEVAKLVPDYDIEMVELHHNKKKDAPSGTAAQLAHIAASAIGKNINEVGVYGRKTVLAERKKDEIGVLSVRGGDIVGEHTVYFAGIGERIELTHRAQSRNTFGAGAIRAAKWIIGKAPGLYDMQDVLGFKKS
ncbi:MAG: 4-hydroxy-tetrahydrodipicolinate reductase [Endomicrobium sp.]|jgi:4-hydroxy-tetrahydrodipicolinate reductase|nr:4-hydroxy-tetrahydrodipicolinate reductase [Endomicrobium sp.]